MNEYILSCCSTADLSEEHFRSRSISYICFHYELDGMQYLDDLGKSMPFDKFYTAMVNGADTKTSQINVDEYINYFEPFLKEGKDILHLSLSSGISGTINSATIARDTLQEQYPDRKIHVMDSLAASSGYSLLIDRLADLRDEGKSLSEVCEWALANRLKLNTGSFPRTLPSILKEAASPRLPVLSAACLTSARS